MIWLVLEVMTVLTTGSSYRPPVEREPAAQPQAWFMQDPERGLWCAFASHEAMTAYAEQRGAGFAVNEMGWIKYRNGVLNSITHSVESEDAIAEDRYIFDRQMKVVQLKRTGHYISAPLATFIYRPDRSGRLLMDSASRRVERRLTAEGQETYITEWRRFRSMAELPFAKLIQVDGAKVTVEPRCLAVTP